MDFFGNYTKLNVLTSVDELFVCVHNWRPHKYEHKWVEPIYWILLSSIIIVIDGSASFFCWGFLCERQELLNLNVILVIIDCILCFFEEFLGSCGMLRYIRSSSCCDYCFYKTLKKFKDDKLIETCHLKPSVKKFILGLGQILTIVILKNVW